MKGLNRQMYLSRLRVWGWALLVALALLNFGCGASPGSACRFDSDCELDDLCIENTCTMRCNDDRDCTMTGSRCEVRNRPDEQPVRVCVQEQQTESEETQRCTSDEQCRERLGDETAVCGDNERCVIPIERHGVLISNASSSGDDSETVELLAVSAHASDGFVGVGYPIAYQQGQNETESAINPRRLTGNTRLSEQQPCPERDKSSTTVPIEAPDGYLLVAFRNSAGARIQLGDIANIQVAEWSRACGETNREDSYNVFFCSSREGRPLNPDVDCDRKLNEKPVSGYQTLLLNQ